MHSFTIAMIMPPSANRALPVRLACVASWLVLVTALTIWAKKEHEPRIMAALPFPTTIAFTFILIFALSETDSLRIRVRRAIPRNRFFQPLSFLFYSGAAGGITLCSIIILSSIAIAYAAIAFMTNVTDRRSFHHVLSCFLGVFFYVLAYGLTASLIRRKFFPVAMSQKFVGVFTLLLIAAGALIPSTIGLLRHFDDKGLDTDTIGYWQITNPAGIVDPKFSSIMLRFAFGWLILMLLLNAKWLYRQFREFCPPNPTKPSP